MIFKKMGRQGWEGIVPIYNTYVLCQELYGNGWKFLLLLIPIYNIYFVIKMNIDWAKAFNQGVGFGIGLLLLPFIFQLILAFGGDQYRDGSYTNTQPDMVENVVNKAKDAVSGNQTTTRSSNCTKQKGQENILSHFFHVFKRNEWKERMKKLMRAFGGGNVPEPCGLQQWQGGKYRSFAGTEHGKYIEREPAGRNSVAGKRKHRMLRS